MDLARLDQQMKMSRSTDFMEYFNAHRSIQSSGIRLNKPDMRLFPEVQPHHQQPIFEIQTNNAAAPPMHNQDQGKLPVNQMQVYNMMQQPGQAQFNQQEFAARAKLAQANMQGNQMRP